MKAPILDKSFVWIPAASHSDSRAFQDRQRQRMLAMQQRPADTKPEPKLRAVRAR